MSASLCTFGRYPLFRRRLTLSHSYLGIYIAIVVLSILAMVYSTVAYTYGGMRASRVVHAKLVRSLLGSTFRLVKSMRYDDETEFTPHVDGLT